MSLSVEVSRLSRIAMFSGIDPGRLKLLAFTGQTIDCLAGEVLFRQDQPSDAVYVVLEGEVEIFREHGDEMVLLNRLGDGQLIGEIGVLCDRTRTATVKAATDLKLLRIEKSVFLDFVQNLPQLALAIIRELSARLDHMSQQMARSAHR